ncbi:MAG: PLP-dependent cysteine synthase family protein [Rikenellaceae bacterium]|nr:PLP-dependent cysteine synthase family protein [Rikenellaceae bacterium]MCL2691889.1 PLP-dependent cysteine synthase family protein [Rikenellaceae bacterium]
MDQKQRLEGLRRMVGNTPLLKIEYTYKGRPRVIYAKAEYMNLTGSIKDRIAYHIFKKAIDAGALKPEMRVLEATSGNTGIAFSAFGSFLGHEVTIFMPDWMSAERINLIKSFGANIRLVSKAEGGFVGSIRMTKDEKAKDPDGVFLPCQFENCDNTEAHYAETGQEILDQLAAVGLTPDAFIAGVGTGGTVMGVGKKLKEKNPAVKVYPLEPESSPTLTTGYQVGKHRIQGISDEFIPEIVKLKELDDIVCVDDGDAIIMSQMLARKLGLGVGISSGGNFIGAVKIQNMLGDDAVVVTTFSDDSKKYLSTDYAREEPVKDNMLSPDIELHCARAI